MIRAAIAARLAHNAAHEFRWKALAILAIFAPRVAVNNLSPLALGTPVTLSASDSRKTHPAAGRTHTLLSWNAAPP